MKKSRPTIGIVKSRVFLTGTAFVLMACSSGEEFAGHSGKGEEPVITPVLCTSGASDRLPCSIASLSYAPAAC